MRTRTFRLICGVFLVWHSVAALNAAEMRRFGPRVHHQIEALHAEKAARTPAQRKLDSQLLYALRQRTQPTAVPGVGSLKPVLRLEADGRSVLVDLRARVNPGLLA